MLGRKFRRRSGLLKTLYKLVDVGSDPLSLKLAKLILAVSFSLLWSGRRWHMKVLFHALLVNTTKTVSNAVRPFRMLKKDSGNKPTSQKLTRMY